MVTRRILYCMTLAAVLLFQITNENYLAHFLLALCIALPVLSLLLSLPGMTGCRLRLAAEPDRVSRGENGQWLISGENRNGLPLPRVTVRLTERDLHAGTEQHRHLALSGVVRRRPIRRPAGTGHCSLLELRADKVRVYDYLGLFSLPSPLPHSARLLAEPVPIDPGPLNIPEGQGARPSGQSPMRRGPGEDYDLREYRPGDPMRSVHWKLSSKWDELIVREPSETAAPLPLLTFDHFGAPEVLDRTLDRLLGLCRALLAVQKPHAVLWLEPDETSRLFSISDEKELQTCLLAILSSPAPEQGTSILDRPELIAGPGGPVFHLHVAPGEEDSHG